MGTVIVIAFIFLVVGVNCEVEDSEDGKPRVSTPLGEVEGFYIESYSGRKCNAFEGIPYAKPPVGSLRFEEPQEIEPWLGVLKATEIHTCIQNHYITGPMPQEVTGDEDCLYLNVYVPKDTSNTNLDVIVHIHGGAFMLGGPEMGGPAYLLDKDIVYVSINYRLGILGFLSTEDAVVPGNNGMKDQVMALRWIKENIENFGGNSNSVTIVGTSAGGASVHLHYFSPLSKELFHKGFSQSGSALDPWVIQQQPLVQAKIIAESVGCDQQSTMELIECMRQRPAKQIVENTRVFRGWAIFPIAPMAPVIEPNLPGAFLVDHPYNILKRAQGKDAPWLVSATTEEGIFPGMFLVNNTQEIDERWEELLPHILEYANTNIDPKEKTHIAQEIKQFYFSNQTLSNENFHLFIKLLSHVFFHRGSEQSARLQANSNKSPVYYYHYGYHQLTPSFSAMFSKEKIGVGHGDDAGLLYKISMFKQLSSQGTIPEADIKVKDHLINIVTSFAATGKPNAGLPWEKVESANFKYLLINARGDLEMKMDATLVPMEFLDALFLRHFVKHPALVKQEL